MDVLTDVLNRLELKGWLSSRRELTPPWRYDFAASKDSMFHVLSLGGAYLQVDGEAEPIRVEDGDVALFQACHRYFILAADVNAADKYYMGIHLIILLRDHCLSPLLRLCIAFIHLLAKPSNGQRSARWEGRDLPSIQENLNAAKALNKRAAYSSSAARIVSRIHD